MVNNVQRGVEKRSFRLVPIHNIPLSVSVAGWFILVVLLQYDVTWGLWNILIFIWSAFGIRVVRRWSGCVLERVLSAWCGWVSVHRCVMFFLAPRVPQCVDHKGGLFGFVFNQVSGGVGF